MQESAREEQHLQDHLDGQTDDLTNIQIPSAHDLPLESQPPLDQSEQLDPPKPKLKGKLAKKKPAYQ